MFRAAQFWMPAYLRQYHQRQTTPAQCRHLILCICDHFEPQHATDHHHAKNRVERWASEYPKLAKEIHEIFGWPIRYTFFFPIEQYKTDLLEPLADICKQGLAELEIHLHHNQDTPANLVRTIEEGKAKLTAHGMLSQDPDGITRYAFIHGNWALANPHAKGKNCGINEELQILQDTGCYADFTMPAAPHPAQSRVINSLYYAADNSRKRAHDHGHHARLLEPGQTRPNGLLLVQGPLMLNWQRRKFGLLPKLENSELAGNHPPTPDRLQLWLKAGIRVKGRPDWCFVKLHTHGCDEIRGNTAMLLGQPMKSFLQHLAKEHQTGQLYTHMVTAREFVNILRAAEQGHTGNPDSCRDFWLKPLNSGARPV